MKIGGNMLELKNVKKTYKIGDIETQALKGINVAFREKEFVAILGTSGSGKTTCLNIIGGLDTYDSGELTIKGKRTKDFKEKDWDAYRNNSIGFVFQSYNLITHLSIVANVELGMTLSGVSKVEKHKRALEVLEEVGLKEHLHKKPNQLSGGQMQRVAIARALANNPEILLCDEPTGALDTTTSIQIMDLIKDVAKDRLVIMVTHNPEIAEEYADRIIKFKDGEIIDDTHPHIEKLKDDEFKLKKTSMSYITALGLSFNNIRTKKGRTFLTAFASSIGIIGIAVILSLSSGFQKQIDSFQSDAMAEFPIMITPTAMSTNEEDLEVARNEMSEKMGGKMEFIDSDEIYLYDPSKLAAVHNNIFTDEYIGYLDNISPDICKNIGYVRMVNMNLLRKADGKVTPVSVALGLNSGASTSNTGMTTMTSMNGAGLYSYPKQLDASSGSYLENNYDVLAGSYPKEVTDLIMVIDNKNRVDYSTLKKLGFNTEGVENLKFTEIVGTELKLVSNNDYYVATEAGNYLPNTNYDAMYDSSNNITLKITGVVRQKEDAKLAMLANGIVYSDELVQKIVDNSLNSDIVKAQQKVNYNIMTMEEMQESAKNSFITYLGGDSKPLMAMLYPTNFESKQKLTEYLDVYNDGKSEENQIIYTDLASTISEMTGGIMDGITLVLIAFAAVSLVVSLIMICIITYTSVLERTKEIGVLKALGARKKDITRVFDAETCILGVFSGLLGIFIAWTLTFPINQVIYNATEMENVAHLKLSYALILVAISTILTMIGGHIPARMASKKDAVEALRSE